MSKAETVHFVVTGEFITQQARSFWNDEDAPERALTLLKTLHGITEAQCLDVLEGRSQLTGDSSEGVQLVPDQAQGKTLKHMLSKLKRERDEARDESADLTQMLIGDTVMVASPTGARKIPRRKSRRSGLSDHVALGPADDYDFDDILNDPERPTPRNGVKPTKPLRIWQQCEPIEYLSRRQRQEQEPEKPKPPSAQDKITTDTGWLSPEGKFYPCLYGQHRLTAEALDIGHGDESWVRLCESNGRQCFFGEHTLFTETQKALVLARCQELKIEEPWWLARD